MKRVVILLAVFAFCTLTTMAQDGSGEANPITSLLKQQVKRYGMLTSAGAEEMPADKYDYRATPDVRTFGELMLHVAQFNGLVCSRVSGMPAPDIKELKATDGKDKIAPAVKASFDFCETALSGLDDSKLGAPAGKMGPMNLTVGGALVVLGEDWFDHYSAEAIYLRLNGLLPPSAQKK
jgi:hypothetical protein